LVAVSEETRFGAHGDDAIVFYYPEGDAPIVSFRPCAKGVVLRIDYRAYSPKIEVTKGATVICKSLLGKLRKLGS
jgi:hypothetical protein